MELPLLRSSWCYMPAIISEGIFCLCHLLNAIQSHVPENRIAGLIWLHEAESAIMHCDMQ